MKKGTLISITGPTAAGKTGASIFLAKKLNCPVISCDSRQFYAEMNIGTAKPTAEEIQDVPHHFIGNLSVTDNYSAGDFERDAVPLIESLLTKHEYVIMVGGSGMFVNAVIEGFDEGIPSSLPEIRDGLMQELSDNGLKTLQDRLFTLDPVYHKQVDLQNPHRVVRALEAIACTGIPYSTLRVKKIKERSFNMTHIGINMSREKLYERINLRVDLMMEAGLLDEVKSLLPHKELPSLRTVGYQEFFDYFDGNTSLEEAVDKVKQNSRRYAKRQLTWFKKNQEAQWFHPNQTDDMLDFVMSQAK